MRASIPLTGHHRGGELRDGWLAVRSVWQRWLQHCRTRAELRAMDARALADIGMDPESARQEVRKFFWQC